MTTPTLGCIIHVNANYVGHDSPASDREPWCAAVVTDTPGSSVTFVWVFPCLTYPVGAQKAIVHGDEGKHWRWPPRVEEKAGLIIDAEEVARCNRLWKDEGQVVKVVEERVFIEAVTLLRESREQINWPEFQTRIDEFIESLRLRGIEVE